MVINIGAANAENNEIRNEWKKRKIKSGIQNENLLKNPTHEN